MQSRKNDLGGHCSARHKQAIVVRRRESIASPLSLIEIKRRDVGGKRGREGEGLQTPCGQENERNVLRATYRARRLLSRGRLGVDFGVKVLPRAFDSSAANFRRAIVRSHRNYALEM